MESNSTTQSQTPSGFFAISPKLDCPHEDSIKYDKILSDLKNGFIEKPCSDCDNTQENWICLECSAIGCSRYFNSHMAKHNEITDHKIALSFTDGSFWCYACESYIHSTNLRNLAQVFSSIKFKDFPDANSAAINSLTEKLSKLTTNETKPKEKNIFTRDDLVNGIKTKQFKKVIFLTGAGISVSAGIPDFRSPKTGIYDNLASYNLPKPEAVFDLAYFKTNPEPFYKVTRDIMKFKANPVISHKFIKIFYDEKLLFLSFTQNIDGLEVAAGVHTDYIIEAHGHYRSARCIKCSSPAPIEEFLKHLEDLKIYKCECSGLIKPDIVFFGETMPEEFFLNFEKINEGDLVIVMGTSLKVYPFAGLISEIPKTVPLVYINRENTSIPKNRDNFLFMEGDIDDQVNQLIKDIGWEDKLKQLNTKTEGNSKL